MSDKPWTVIPDSRLERYRSGIFEYFDPSEWMSALHEVHERLEDEDFWILFGEVWTEEAGHYMHNEGIREMLTPKRMASHHRHQCMNEHERTVFEELPDQIPIFRGCWSGNMDGWSWTRSEDLAREFACSTPMNDKPLLLSGVAHREDVVAYFDRNKEQEIVVDPTKVIECEEEALSPVDWDKGHLEFQQNVQAGKLNLYSPEKLASKIESSGIEPVEEEAN